MRKLFLAVLALCLCHTLLFAQNPYSVRGLVIDTASNVPLTNSSIVILNARDSMLVKFGRAGEKGDFSVNNLKTGDFILMVSYPDYADYIERFTLSEAKPTVNFGRLRMVLTARLLQEVIVKGNVAEIVIKGDTTEFNAAAFKVDANAKVEDLLKQLPGVQVDKDGKITAHGQAVNKVLVDGEEFFGDDPTLVTKNIRSDMVDKVQLYDKKSDQATFTGIDDGERTKTLNIKLKEDKKSGYFGKADAGAGNDDYYQGQLMFNAFKGKRKFSAYGTISNTGKTGLNWEDNNRFGTSSAQVSDEGFIYISSGGDELDSYGGRYNGEGIPVTRSGGLHYDTKWKEDKHSINLNYKAGTIDIGGTNNSLNQNNLPSGIINSVSNRLFDNYLFRHKMDATYLVKLDTTAELKIVVDGTLRNTDNISNYSTASSRENGTALNNSTRLLSSDGNASQLNASALFTKKLRKKGRTISLSVSERYNSEDSDGFLNSQNTFYSLSGLVDSIQNIDQYKTNSLSNSVLSTNVTYTEPISKTFSATLNYGYVTGTSSSDKRSFNRTPASGRYDQLDTQFSNNFDFDQTSNQAGAIFAYRKDKTVINFGTKTSAVTFRQTDLFTGTVYKRDFLNWLPQALYQYNFTKQKSFSFRYNGNTTQPNINQTQPVRINNDPLNITLGNPNLGPSFQNRFNASFNSYKVLSDQQIYLNVNYSFQSNAIVNNTTTDAAGKTTFQYFNLKDRMPSNVGFYSYYSQKIPNTDFRLGIDVNGYQAKYYNMINSVINKTNQGSYSARISAQVYKQKKFEFYTSAGPQYITTESSLQPLINNNGWGGGGWLELSWWLPGKVVLRTSGNYSYQPKTRSFTQDFNRFIVNTTLTKDFLKSDALKFSLTGNDILNQNLGFSRSAQGNMIVQNSYTTIRRYFLASVSYDLNHMGGGAPKK